MSIHTGLPGGAADPYSILDVLAQRRPIGLDAEAGECSRHHGHQAINRVHLQQDNTQTPPHPSSTHATQHCAFPAQTAAVSEVSHPLSDRGPRVSSRGLTLCPSLSAHFLGSLPALQLEKNMRWHVWYHTHT